MLKEYDVGLVSPIYTVFEMKDTITPTFFYYYMKQPIFQEMIKHHAIGTTRQNFPFEAFKMFPMVVPPMELQLKFEEIAKPIEQKIAKLKEENEVLAEIRDTPVSYTHLDVYKRQPIIFLSIACEFTRRQYAFSSLQANCVGNLSQLVMVGNMVFKLPPGTKRYRIYHNMIVKIICVQVGGNDYLIILAPHTPCSFQSDLMRFFGGDFPTTKALVSVIGNIPAEFAVTTLSSHHIFVCSLFRTVDTRNIHRLIRLFIILNITAVSYTHLDVYKRQTSSCCSCRRSGSA